MNFKKFVAILTTIAPVILLTVPGGAALAPLVPLIVAGIADAQKKPGATAVEKKAYVMALVQDAVDAIEQTKPGLVDPSLLIAASDHAIEAVLQSVKAVEHAHAALPTLPAAMAPTVG